jgi:hypothetical protein
MHLFWMFVDVRDNDPRVLLNRRPLWRTEESRLEGGPGKGSPGANAVMMPMHIPLPKASAGSWLSTARQPGITVFALCRVSSSAEADPTSDNGTTAAMNSLPICPSLEQRDYPSYADA